jgi:DNA-binding transcriptional MocR family regulator
MSSSAHLRISKDGSETAGRKLFRKNPDMSLVEQIVVIMQSKIDEKLLRVGTRLPSIRTCAEEYGVSRFTVVEAYDRLVAKGYLDSRRGAGFFVKDRVQMVVPRSGGAGGEPGPQRLDIAWLVRSMFRQHPAQSMPGSGLLPVDWMSSSIVGNSFRAVARESSSQIFQYGVPQGYVPLRQQLQLKLASIEIAAAPEQIVTTSGVTQGLDLVARHLLAPGDVVFVDDPAWFLMFGSFAALGAKVIGIPRTTDGPDVATLMRLAEVHRPKMYVLNSILHNPSSTSLSSAKAYQVLNAAEKYGFTIVEDDVYCDLHPGNGRQAGTRIASLDQLNRVIYLGGFSKTLAANLRVGFIAASHEVARQLTDRKMLSTLTTSEIGERLVFKVLSEGHYRKHVERLRSRLDEVREEAIQALMHMDLKVDHNPTAGMFVWVDTGADTSVLAARAMRDGLLLAPGALFSPAQLPSNWMRINVAALAEPAVLKSLTKLVRM